MTLHKQLEQKRSYVSCDEQYHVFHDNFSVLVVLIEYVSIFLGQFVFSSSFPTLRKILVTNGQRNGIPELCYVLKISIKFSSSQYWCIYRGPRVHGVGLGDLDTSVYKNLRKVWKNRCGQTTEQPSNRDGVQRTDFVMTGVSVLLCNDWCQCTSCA